MDSKRYRIAQFGNSLHGNLTAASWSAAWFDREKDASVKDLIEKNIVTMQQEPDGHFKRPAKILQGD